jgi:hypothetical protein
LPRNKALKGILDWLEVTLNDISDGNSEGRS